MMGILGWVSIAVVKHHDQKQLGKKRFCFSIKFSGHTPSLRGDRAGTQGRSLESGTEAEAVEEDCLLACSSWVTQSVFFLYKLRSTSPGTASSTMGFALPHQSLIKKIHHRLYLGPIWLEHLPNESFCIPRSSSLCQAD